jgi:formate-dependent nitrite reductase cytochrome c552 subunit
VAAPQDAEEGFYEKSEYCQTCHYQYYDYFDKHTRHDKEQVQCDDCHVPLLASSGDRYSIHDHRFDFSQPESPCSECHLPGEVDEEAKPPHEFNIQPVRIKEKLTIEEACLRCHSEKDLSWVKEKIGTLKFRL